MHTIVDSRQLMQWGISASALAWLADLFYDKNYYYGLVYGLCVYIGR